MKNKLIGLYELITGIFGAILLLMNFNKAIGSLNMFITLGVGIILYLGSAYAGYALLNNLKNGVKFSIWTQGLQSFSLILPGFIYKFSGSAFVSLIVGNKGIRFDFNMAPIDYAINTTSAGTTQIQIYLVALVMLFLLIREK